MKDLSLTTLAEEWADKHFLDGVDMLMDRPWPEAKERYKDILVNFGRIVLSNQWNRPCEQLPDISMNRKKKGLYRTNKEAKVGEIIECPVCHIKFKKIQWAQAFCCGHCKDKFWNRQNPDRHKYADCSADDGMPDHDWGEAFAVAEYNDAE